MLLADYADQPELLKGWWFSMIWHVEIQFSDSNQVCFLQLFMHNLSVYGILIQVGMLCVVSCFFCILLIFCCILLHLLSWFCTYSFFMTSDRIEMSCVFWERIWLIL